MAPLTPAELYEKLQTLCVQHRINFRTELEPSEWPSNLRQTFSAFKELGNERHSEYSEKAELVAKECPWKQEISSKAVELAYVAGSLEGEDEADWRFQCEHIVFGRLHSDIDCFKCTGRLWRSEIEFLRASNGGRDNDLLSRRQNRRPCVCSREKRIYRSTKDVEKGSRLFAHRTERRIIHKPTIKGLPRKVPDYVCGLKMTENFQALLFSSARPDLGEADAPVKDVVRSSPIKWTDHPLLFPFMVLESKSGTGSPDWDSIKLQSAFSIKACLDIQYSLQRKNETWSDWAGPLVWFLMQKAEHWQFWAAYIEKRVDQTGEEATEYTITKLWEGSITTLNGALQILLITGGIVDWARDIYREDILKELRILSTGEQAGSVVPDKDIWSKAGVNELMEHSLAEEQATEIGPREVDVSHALDEDFGVVRHARNVETKFRMLFIRRNDVKTMFDLTKPTQAQSLARRILTELSSRPLRVNINTLNALEKQWTGNIRHAIITRSFGSEDNDILAVVTFGTYIGQSWEQVREMCVIAVEDDAYQYIVRKSEYTQPNKTKKPEGVEVSQETIQAMISRFQNTTPSQTLLAAISRLHYRIEPYTQAQYRGHAVGTVASIESSMGRMNISSRPNPSLRLYKQDGGTQKLVNYVYNIFKRGILEPDVTFLRYSSRHDDVQSNSGDAEPYADFAKLDISDSRAILVCGPSLSLMQRSKGTSLCVYFFSQYWLPETKSGLAGAIKDTFENRDMYHTIRNVRSGNLKPVKPDEDIWNISGVHGFDTRQSSQVMKWLWSLDYQVPRRQGSPRNFSSGRYLITRNYRPWLAAGQDAEFDDVSAYYYLKLISAEFLYWGTVAERKNRLGTACCVVCAVRNAHLSPVDGLYHCTTCLKEIESPSIPICISNTMAKTKPSRAQTRDYLPIEPRGHGLDDWYDEIRNHPRVDDGFSDMAELQEQVEDSADSEQSVSLSEHSADSEHSVSLSEDEN